MFRKTDKIFFDLCINGPFLSPLETLELYAYELGIRVSIDETLFKI